MNDYKMNDYKMNATIVVFAAVLFILFSPGTLFTIPSRKKKSKNIMDIFAKNKTQIIFVHTMLYTVALLLSLNLIKKYNLKFNFFQIKNIF